jgi:hypothetical protein
VGRDVSTFIDTEEKSDGTMYYYAIHCWNNFTNTTDFSNVVNIRYYTPIANINLSAANQSFYLNGSQVRLNWTDVADAYYILYTSMVESDLEDLDNLTPFFYDIYYYNYTTLTLTEPGSHYFRVRAVNETRGNQTSQIVEYSIQCLPISPGSILIRNSIKDIEDGIASLSWIHPNSDSLYTFHIYRYYLSATGQKMEENLIASVSTSSYVDSDLRNNNYHYYIRSENSTGFALSFSSVSNTTIRRIPLHPSLKLETDIISRDGKVKFTWNVTTLTEKQVVVRMFANQDATAKFYQIYDSKGELMPGVEFRNEGGAELKEHSETGLKKGYWIFYVVASNDGGIREIDPNKTLVVYVDESSGIFMGDALTQGIIVAGIVMVVSLIGYAIYKKKVEHSW